MDEDEGSSPPFALELPQNDVIFVDQETRTKRDVDRSFSERPIELENIDLSHKDNDDSNSSCVSSVGNLSEVAPDIPPDYNDNPCTYLEREGAVAPAGLTMPAVVAGNVGNMHFSINSGGGATSGAHRTSCSINDTLTEVLTAESIEGETCLVFFQAAFHAKGYSTLITFHIVCKYYQVLYSTIFFKFL